MVLPQTPFRKLFITLELCMTNESTDTNYPRWCKPGDADTCSLSRENLLELFDLALRSVGMHYDWFIRHRASALKQLAVLLSAELIIVKLFYDSTQVPIQLIILTLLFLAIFSPIFALSGAGAVKKSYTSTLYYITFAVKIAWTIGLDKIDIDSHNVNLSKIPVKNDATFYIPKFLKDSFKFSSTEDFTNYHLKKTIRRNQTTYFWGWLSIWFLGFAGFIIGIGFAWFMGLSDYIKPLYWFMI